MKVKSVLNRRWTPMDADERGMLFVGAQGNSDACSQELHQHEFALTIGVHRRPSAVSSGFGQ
jgi:hypothetical protein